jgi:hypothetical protein
VQETAFYPATVLCSRVFYGPGNALTVDPMGSVKFADVFIESAQDGGPRERLRMKCAMDFGEQSRISTVKKTLQAYENALIFPLKTWFPASPSKI